MRRRCGWIVAGLLLAAPVDAAASTVSTVRRVDDDATYLSARFTAARGEENRLTVRPGGIEGLIIRDTGSRVRARGACKSLGRHAAVCPADDADSISLGDRNDRVIVLGTVAAIAYAGAGNDRLTGTEGDVWFAGGRGNDVLRGSASYDRLTGGPGRDRLYGRGEADELFDGETDANAARDLFDGGAPGFGGNTLDFSRRRDALRIDLERGQASTHDTIVRIRNVTGGSGDDHLTGDAAGNTLSGGPSHDTIDGGTGNDVAIGGFGDDRLSGGLGDDGLFGSAGEDRLDGGLGDDRLDSREPDDDGGQGTPAMPDEVTCGDDADMAESDASDTLEPACEQMRDLDIELGTVPTLIGDHAEFIATSFSGIGPGLGRHTLSLDSLTGEEYGSTAYVVPPDGTITISVPLTAAGVAALRAGTVMQVNLVHVGVSSGYRMFLRAG
jgi:RTX calcium-binding nonapeptide repeat (4 copies)